MLQHARNELASEENRLEIEENPNTEESFVVELDDVEEKPKRRTGGRRPKTPPTIEVMRTGPDADWRLVTLAEYMNASKASVTMRLAKHIKDGLVKRVSRGVYKLTKRGR